jgi:AraC-like DNA-binding protein
MKRVQGHANRTAQQGIPSEFALASPPDARTPATQFVEIRVLDWEPPLEVLRARYTVFGFPMHAHAEYTIGEVTEGTEVFMHRGVRTEAPSGSTIHISPSESHNGRAAGKAWAYVAAYPGIELLRATMPEYFRDGTPSFRSPVSLCPKTKGRLIAFVQGVFLGSDPLWAQSEFLDFVALLLESDALYAQKQDVNVQTKLRIVREFLDDAPAQNATLIDLARLASLPPLALLRAFRRQIGSTPYVYRTARRIEVAKKLLRECRPIAEVALDCGFADQSHLTTTFRRWTGVTPGVYARSLQSSRRKT